MQYRAKPKRPPQPTEPVEQVSDLFTSLDPKGAHYYLGQPLHFEDLYSLMMPAGERGSPSQTVSAKIPNELCQAMDYLIASRTTPFASRTDLIRSGVFMLVHRLAELEKGPKMYRDAVRVIHMGVLTAQVNQRKRDMQRYLEETEELLRGLIADGNDAEAATLLKKTRAKIESLDDAYWRKMGEQWLEEAATLASRRRR